MRYFALGMLEPVPLIQVEVGFDNITTEDGGSGSGLPLLREFNPATELPNSGAYITDFQNLTSDDDSVGGLYAYYYSNTSVVLGTRSAAYLNISDIAIGISPMTEVYICQAQNFPERGMNESGISFINVTINANIGNLETTVHSLNV